MAIAGQAVLARALLMPRTADPTRKPGITWITEPQKSWENRACPQLSKML